MEAEPQMEMLPIVMLAVALVPKIQPRSLGCESSPLEQDDPPVERDLESADEERNVARMKEKGVIDGPPGLGELIQGRVSSPLNPRVL